MSVPAGSLLYFDTSTLSSTRTYRANTSASRCGCSQASQTGKFHRPSQNAFPTALIGLVGSSTTSTFSKLDVCREK